MMAGLVNLDLQGLGSAVGALGGLAKDIRAAITGTSVVDAVKQAELEAKALEIEAQVATAQAAINAAEAAKGGFAGNWRPAIGWICALALAYNYLAQPAITWFVGSAGPKVDMAELYPLLLGMLGLVGARSFEKVRGVAR
jgi:hypothetical protein